MVCDARAFDRVFQEGRHAVKGDLSLHYAANGMGLSRFAFVIPAKVGKAHERNALRRKLREIAREAQPGVETGFDIVFIVRKIAGLGYEELRGTMRWLMSGKGLLKGGE